jgi:type 1 fimbria pilin
MTNDIFYKKTGWAGCVTLCLFVFMGLFSASNSFADSNAFFHGTLVVVDCKVDTDSVDVDFGTVRTDLIDGTSYDLQPVPFKVTCTSQVSGTIQVSFESTQTAPSWDNNAIGTDNADLGIHLFKDGKAINPLTWFDVQHDVDLKLTAAPVAKKGATLSGGDFFATAKIKIQVI